MVASVLVSVGAELPMCACGSCCRTRPCVPSLSLSWRAIYRPTAPRMMCRLVGTKASSVLLATTALLYVQFQAKCPNLAALSLALKLRSTRTFPSQFNWRIFGPVIDAEHRLIDRWVCKVIQPPAVGMELSIRDAPGLVDDYLECVLADEGCGPEYFHVRNHRYSAFCTSNYSTKFAFMG
jgi:hypothetical protein